jgi:flagellar protein FliS
MSYKDDLAVKIATYTGEQMVALAYEAMIENLEDAKNAIINKDLDLLNDKIDHNREIISHLTATMGEEEDNVSLTTKQLYLYINKLMTDSVIRKDTQILDEAIKIIIPLRDGWRELSKQLQELEAKKAPSIQSKSARPNVYAGMTYGKSDISIYSDSKDWDKG